MSDDKRTMAEILGPAKMARLMSEAHALDEILPAVERYAAEVGLPVMEAFERLIPIAREFLLAFELDRSTPH